MWLLRVADKGRAAAAGTIHDYIYPCPMDQGVLVRWGVTPEEFDDALRTHATDDALYQWLLGKTTLDRIATANEWLETEKVENLNRQDAEEGAAV